MRLIYHPDAEVELIEAAKFYEQRVSTLGAQFLDAVDQPVRAIVDAPRKMAYHRRGCPTLPYASLSLRDLL